MKKLALILCCVIAILTLTNTNSLAVVPAYKGVCKPRVDKPKEKVCVLTDGTKDCNVDSDCKPPPTD